MFELGGSRVRVGGYVYVIYVKQGGHRDNTDEWLVEYVGSTIGTLGPYCRLTRHRNEGRWAVEDNEACDYITIPPDMDRRRVESLIWMALGPRRNKRDPLGNWGLGEGKQARLFLQGVRDDTEHRMRWLAARVLAINCARTCATGRCGVNEWWECVCDCHECVQESVPGRGLTL